jgi:hypothetical protein
VRCRRPAYSPCAASADARTSAAMGNDNDGSAGQIVSRSRTPKRIGATTPKPPNDMTSAFDAEARGTAIVIGSCGGVLAPVHASMLQTTDKPRR